jgi:hypothetical protein
VPVHVLTWLGVELMLCFSASTVCEWLPFASLASAGFWSVFSSRLPPPLPLPEADGAGTAALACGLCCSVEVLGCCEAPLGRRGASGWRSPKGTGRSSGLSLLASDCAACPPQRT